MSARLPDGTSVLVVVVDGAKELLIEGIDSSILESMPIDVALEF
jgi:hypothetical protein